MGINSCKKVNEGLIWVASMFGVSVSLDSSCFRHSKALCPRRSYGGKEGFGDIGVGIS